MFRGLDGAEGPQTAGGVLGVAGCLFDVLGLADAEGEAGVGTG
jgi:hypothetical protein